MKIKSQGTQLILSLLLGSFGALYVGFAELLLSLFCFAVLFSNVNLITAWLVVIILNALLLRVRNERVKNELI